MTFWQYLLATFGGVGLGFVFSILLFYLTNRWGRNARKKTLERNLIKEFTFDERYLQELVRKFDAALQDITVEDRNAFHYFNYRSYQQLFTTIYLSQDFIYDKLTPNDVYKLRLILDRMTFPGEQFINNLMQKWNQNAVSSQDALKFVRLERDSMSSFIKDIQQIRGKIIGK